MKNKILHLDEKDNVVVALDILYKGDKISFAGNNIVIKEDIKTGHKIAIRNISKDEKIIKFGQVIGKAVEEISSGSLVHTHNIVTNLVDYEEYVYTLQKTEQKINSPVPNFMGYRRKNGKVGIRNEIWIINTVGCVNTSAERIAKICNERLKRDNFDGVYSFSHPYGCSQLGDDLLNTKKVLEGLINNPNAGGILVMGLGCENLQLDSLMDTINRFDRDRIIYFNSQEVNDEIETGIASITKIFENMKNDKRELCPVSDLIVGMKCGGSDSFSGITANPLVGKISDKLTAYGASILLTEVPEMFGAEQQLLNRAKNKQVYHSIIDLINNFKKYFIDHNKPIYENPSPGNKEGGISTLEEKSLGAIQKGGTSIINDVLEYGQQIKEKGLSLLNAPGNDGVSSTAMVVSGATLLLFTTGRGTPLGFPVPTLKISSNSELYEKKRNWVDFDAGVLVSGEKKIQELTDELFDFIIKVASGEIKTKNEINGNREISIWKTGVTL